MNTQLLKVKRTKNCIRVILAVFVCLLVSVSAFAQSVNISINVIPPYSPYYSDYSGINASKVFVVLTNLTNTQQKIKLIGKLQGDNGVSITTYTNYTPLQPIILSPHEVRQMNGTSLKDIFDLNNLSVRGIDKAKLAASSRIPEGNYDLCLQAVDYNSRAILSPLAPSGCTYLTIAYPEPPVLVNPSPSAFVYATTPQSIVFSWINPGTVPMGIQYKIEMAQMPDQVSSDPNQVLNATSFPMLSKQITALSYLYSVQDLALIPGQRYAWRVTAIDPTGKTVFKNNGVSPASVFTYGSLASSLTQASTALFDVFVPNYKQNFEQVNDDNDFVLVWNYYYGGADDTLKVDNGIYKQLGVTQYHVEILPASKSTGKLTDNAFSYNTFINTQKVPIASGPNDPTQKGIIKIPKYTTSLAANLNKTTTQCDSLGLKDQFWYKANIYALDANGRVVNKATSVDFQYQHIKDITTQKISVTARLKYQFKGYPDINVAPNTPVEIVALQKVPDSKYQTTNTTSILNTVVYNGRKYVKIGSGTGVSDNAGKVVDTLTIPRNADTEGLYYQVNVKSQYYVTPSANVYSDSVNLVSPNLGEIMLGVHAYSLKLNVSEAFQLEPVSAPITDTKKAGIQKPGITLNYSQVINRAKAGIPVVLYRRNKKNNIPPIEGQLITPATTDKDGIEQIAHGLTVLETQPDGTQKSYVQFDKLLCNIYNGDQYYFLAVDSTQYGKDATAGNKVFALKPYTDQHIKATEQAFSYNVTATNGQGSLYSNTTGFYSLQSTLPPEATITGQIVYQWPADSSKTRRPLANQHFTVRVMPANPSAVDTTNTYGKNIIYNNDPVRGVGTTDAHGNFTVKVVVMNVANYGDKLPNDSTYNNPNKQKNSSGPTLTPYAPSLSDPVTSISGIQSILNNNNPLAGLGNLSGLGSLTGEIGNASNIPGNGAVTSAINELEKVTMQNGMNLKTGVSFTSDGTGGFSINVPAVAGANINKNINQGIQGPNFAENTDVPIEEALTDTILHSKFYINFEDVLFTNNPKEVIDVDAFSTTNAGIMVANVDGGSRKTTVYDYHTKKPLPGMRVLVFKPVNSNPPLGQGDGLNTVGQLVKPTMGNVAAENIYLKQEEIYTQKTTTVTGKKGGSYSSTYTSGAIAYKDTVVDETAMLNGTYSIYWNGLTDNNGQITVPNLLLHDSEYNTEATSDPNNEAGVFYEPTIGKFGDSILVISLPSRIAGRLIDVSNNSVTGKAPLGLAGSTVRILSNGNKIAQTITDGQGYFEINTDTLAGNRGNGLSFSLGISAPGYKQQDATPISGTIAWQGAQFNKVIPMVPTDSVKGQIFTFDTFSNGVKSYIQRADGAVVTTDDHGNFSIPIANNNAQTTLTVIPVDVGYFSDTYTITKKDIDNNVFQHYNVFRREHRFYFVVKDADNNQPLGAANLYIDAKTVLTTDAQGVIKYSFENVSVNNYSFRIYGADGSGYIPQTLNITNNESRTADTIIVKMQKGSIIKGVVNVDGKPVPYARVYANIKMQASPISLINTSNTGVNDATLVQAYSKQDGSYVLSGVPVTNGQIEITATLDTAFTVGGDTKNVTISQGSGNQNFALTRYTNMVINNLFGFPLTVESIAAGTDQNHAVVTGTIDLGKGVSDFALLPGNKVVRVRNVTYAVNTTSGQRVGSPVGNNVNIEGVSSLKFRYLDKYNVQIDNQSLPSAGAGSSSVPASKMGLTGTPVASNQTSYTAQTSELTITKTAENKGVIKGPIHIVDNSFNYPSTYLNFNNGSNNLYLADASNGKVNTSLAAVTASYPENDKIFLTGSGYSTVAATVLAQLPYKKYNLSTASGDSVQLQFVRFNSTADPMNSYIDSKAKIHLAINMKCHVANATPENFNVSVSNIVLDDDSISVTQSQQPIIVKLEKWNLYIKKWSLSPIDGGFASNDGLIQTGAIDIPFTQFNLRSDMFVIGGFSLGNLQLGGGLKTLNVISANNAALEYDQEIGSDQGTHWKFAIAGSGNAPAATVDGLPSLSGSVGLSYIQMISNGESILTLQENTTPLIINNNSLAQFSPQGIVSGPGFFDIAGSLNINAPRFSAMPLTMHYSGSVNNLNATFKSVTQDFEGKGYVHFTALATDNNISITKDSLVIKGNVSEKPTTTFQTIPAIFVANPNSLTQKYKVLLQPVAPLPIVAGSYDLNISSGGMKVVGNDWDILSFKGTLMEKQNNSGKPGMLGNNSLTFNVYGDVQIAGDAISTSTTIPGFGKCELTLDFQKPAIHGSINIQDQDIGGFTVGGVLEMEFDNKGFYIGGAAVGGAPIPIPGLNELVSGKVKLGFLVGDYQLSTSDAIWGEVTQYQVVKNDCWLSSLGNRLAGFYYTYGAQVTIGREINLEVVDVAFKADLGYDISMGLDFSKGKAKGQARFIAMYSINADAEAGLASYLTGTSVDFSIKIGAALLGAINFDFSSLKPTSMTLAGAIDLSAQLLVRQSLLVKTVTLLDLKENLSIQDDTDGGFSLKFSSGNPPQLCIPFN